MHIRLSDRHAGKAAEAPVVPRPGLFCVLSNLTAVLSLLSLDRRDGERGSQTGRANL